MPTFKLKPFSANEKNKLLQLNASVSFSSDIASLTWQIEGQLDSVLFKTLRGNAQQLWKHTCFEFFLQSKAPACFEWNISPSGQSYCFQFDDYREKARRPDSELLKTVLSCSSKRIAAGVFTAEAKFRIPFNLDDVPKGSLTAVVEMSDHTLSYWAVNHSRTEPDFHAPESFVVLN